MYKHQNCKAFFSRTYGGAPKYVKKRQPIDRRRLYGRQRLEHSLGRNRLVDHYRQVAPDHWKLGNGPGRRGRLDPLQYTLGQTSGSLSFLAAPRDPELPAGGVPRAAPHGHD